MKYALILLSGFLIGKATNPVQAVTPFFTKADIEAIMIASYKVGYEDGSVERLDHDGLVLLTEDDIHTLLEK